MELKNKKNSTFYDFHLGLIKKKESLFTYHNGKSYDDYINSTFIPFFTPEFKNSSEKVNY